MDAATLSLLLASLPPGTEKVDDSALILSYFMVGLICVWFSNGPEIEVLSENRVIRIFQRLCLLFLWPVLILVGVFKMMTR